MIEKSEKLYEVIKTLDGEPLTHDFILFVLNKNKDGFNSCCDIKSEGIDGNDLLYIINICIDMILFMYEDVDEEYIMRALEDFRSTTNNKFFKEGEEENERKSK